MTAIIETPAAALDASSLIGEWINTNAQGRMMRIVVTPSESEGPGRLGGAASDLSSALRPSGPLADDRGDRKITVTCDAWGTVDAPLYSFTFEERKAGAFNALFDTPQQRVHMQANVKAGVLVVATFNEMKDGRSNWFDREFFHRISGE